MILTVPAISAVIASPLGFLRASKSSSTRGRPGGMSPPAARRAPPAALEHHFPGLGMNGPVRQNAADNAGAEVLPGDVVGATDRDALVRPAVGRADDQG